MENTNLEIYDDKVEYTAEEIHNLIGMIDSGNRLGGGGFSKVISAFGIVGRYKVFISEIIKNHYTTPIWIQFFTLTFFNVFIMNMKVIFEIKFEILR